MLIGQLSYYADWSVILLCWLVSYLTILIGQISYLSELSVLGLLWNSLNSMSYINRNIQKTALPHTNQITFFLEKDNYGKLNCNILFIAPKTLYSSVCELLINFLIALVIIPIFILLLHVLIFMIPVCELDHLRKLYGCHVLPVTHV